MAEMEDEFQSLDAERFRRNQREKKPLYYYDIH